MKIKRLLTIFFLSCLMLVFINGSCEKVMALNENDITPRAMETYTRDITVGCGAIGHTNLTITITHNMTTGNSWISKIDRDDYIYPPFALICQIKSVKTDPGINDYFTGVISIKITVTYSISGDNYQSIEYVNS